MGRGLKGLLALLVFILFVLAATFFLRNVIAKKVIAFVLAEQQAKVSCIDFNLDWSANIYFSRLCIDLPEAKIEAENAHWTRSENNLSIAHVTIVQVNKTGSIDGSEGLHSIDLSLSPGLPSMQINKLTISSPRLVQPLQLKVGFEHELGISVSGDLSAHFAIKDGKLISQVSWSLWDAYKYLEAFRQLHKRYADILTEDALNSAKIVSDILFDGRQLQTSHELTFLHELTLPNCTLFADIQGRADTSPYALSMDSAVNIDLKKLQSHVDFSQCKALPEQLNDWQLKQVVLNFPQNINITHSKIDIPQLILTINTGNAEQHIELLVSDVLYDFSGMLSASLRVQGSQDLALLSPLKGSVNLVGSGDISLKLVEEGGLDALEWRIHHSYLNFTLNNIQHKQLGIAQTLINLNIAGDQRQGISFNGNLVVTGLVSEENTIDEFSSQLTATSDLSSNVDIEINNQFSDIVWTNLNIANLKNVLTVSSGLTEESWQDWRYKFQGISLDATSNVDEINYHNIKLNHMKSTLVLNGQSFNELEVAVDTQFDKGQGNNWNIDNMTNHISAKLKQLETLDFVGKSTLNAALLDFSTFELILQPINFEHKGMLSLNLGQSHSSHDVVLQNGFKFNVEQNNTELNLHILQQDIANIQTLLSQINPELIVSTGTVSSNLNVNEKEQIPTVMGQVELVGISGRFAHYLFTNLSVLGSGEFNSAGLQLNESTLHVGSINVGMPINQIAASLSTEDGVLKLQNLAGDILGGHFNLNEIWLDQRKQHFNLTIEDIDLEQVVALQDQPGINITGRMSGHLPVVTTSQSFNIEHGLLATNHGGVLSINNNPAFNSIKQQQAELAFLENFHFSQLSSQVTLKPDGWLFLDLAFAGQNPDKKQAVNFNYTHEENLFTLLETLRVTNSIQNKIEQNISQGGKQ